jgi:hypothetical protein
MVVEEEMLLLLGRIECPLLGLSSYFLANEDLTFHLLKYLFLSKGLAL